MLLLFMKLNVPFENHVNTLKIKRGLPRGFVRQGNRSFMSREQGIFLEFNLTGLQMKQEIYDLCY